MLVDKEKALVIKLGEMNLIPESQMVEGENQLLQVSSDLCMRAYTHAQIRAALRKFRRYYLCVCCQETTLWSLFSPSTFPWVLGRELGLPNVRSCQVLLPAELFFHHLQQ